MNRNKQSILLYILILLLISCGKRTAVTRQSSATEQMLETATELTAMSRPDSALALLDSALKQTDLDDTLHAMIIAEKANNMLILGRMADALPLCRQAISEGESIGNDEVLINQYSTCGIIYRRLGLADSALWAYRRGIEVSKRVGMKDYVANLYNNIAVAYTETGRLSEGIGYADEAMRWAREARDTVEIFSALATKSSILMRQKAYHASIATIKPHFQTILSAGSIPLILKTASPMLQSCIQAGRLDDAERYLKAIKPAIQSVEPASNGSLGIMEIEAALLHARRDYRNELALWYRIDSLSHENNGVPEDRRLNAIAECLRLTGNTAKALDCMTRAYKIADSTKNSGINRQLSEFSVRYKTQQKELQIASLNREKATQRAHFMTIVLVLTIAVMLLTLCIVAILYRRRIAEQRYQLNLRRKYIQGLESERARLARELHDGVCNDLLGLQILMASGDKTKAQTVVKEIMTGVRQVSHDLMPPRFNNADISTILADYVTHYPIADCNVRFSSTSTDRWHNIDEAKAFDIYRITQELMGNIARHSNAHNINVQLTYDNTNKIVLTVENDGTEMRLPAETDGIGLYTTADRVRSMNGEIQRSENNGMYKVEISLYEK